MKSANRISLKAGRIIPFDVGVNIDDAIIAEIAKKFKNVKTEREFLLEDRVVKIETKIGNASLEIDLFRDGIGIVSFVEELLTDSTERFDPFRILQQRTQVHHAILKHEHAFSEAIDKTVQELRETARRSIEVRSRKDLSKIRFTASQNWEKKGLSYVMSIYFISSPEFSSKLRNPKEKEIRRKFAPLMEPSIYRAENTFTELEFPMSRFQTRFVEETFLDEISGRVFAIDYDIDPLLSTFMTWPSVLVVGDIDDYVVHEYMALEKKLQHVWFYSYIADNVVRRALEQFDMSRSEVDVDYLDRLRSEILLRIDEFTNVQESTLGSRYFKLFNGLMKSSQLDLLVSSLDKKVGLLGTRIEREASKNREKGQKRIELVLFVLTYLSGVSSVLTVLSLTNIYLAILLNFPLILLILILYDL